MTQNFEHYQSIKALITGLSEHLLRVGAKPEDLSRLVGNQDELEIKNFFLETVLNHVEHAKYILNKSWLLYKTNESHSYYISDNPVTLHNDIDMGVYGNLGLDVHGIQIHLPISSSLTLAFVCPSHEKKAIQAREQLQFIVNTDIRQLVHIKNPKMIVDYADAYKKGTPVEITSENTRFLNSLQVAFSEQYVYCGKNEFSLAHEMMRANSAYRTGFRPKMN